MNNLVLSQPQNTGIVNKRYVGATIFVNEGMQDMTDDQALDSKAKCAYEQLLQFKGITVKCYHADNSAFCPFKVH
jgi:hypothetical protein